MITTEQFKAATGRDPENDDLDRVNCKYAGHDDHWQCGWDPQANRPIFETGSDIWRKLAKLPNI